jgi:hypothetical protein
MTYRFATSLILAVSLAAAGTRPAWSASLYVADAQTATVVRFPLQQDIPQLRPAGTLQLGNAPAHIAVGPPGFLFVSYGKQPVVDVFASQARGRAVPLRELAIAKPPTSIAVDSAGYLYVAGVESGVIDIYAPGASGRAGPFERILVSNTSATKLVALDPQGRLFVVISSEGLLNLLEYADPLTNPTFVRLIGFPALVWSAAIDVMHEAYVIAGSTESAGSIGAYSPSACCAGYPVDRTIAPLHQTFFPLAIAIRNRHAFVASGSGSSLVDTFDLFGGTQRPLAVIAGSFLPLPVAIAVDL